MSKNLSKGLLLMAMLISTCAKEDVAIERLLIKPDFTGHVIILYEIKGAPALPREHEATLVQVPMDGVVMTSSSLMEGRFKREVFLAKDSGLERVGEADVGGIRAEVSGEYFSEKNKMSVVFQSFYVGPGNGGDVFDRIDAVIRERFRSSDLSEF